MSPKEWLSSRAADLDREIQRMDRRTKLISWLRLAVFLAAGALAVAGFWSAPRPGLIGGAGILGLVFLALVAAHDRAFKALARARMFGRVNQEALARLALDWDHLNPGLSRGEPSRTQGPDEDLDIFGRASLFRLVCTAATPGGMATLASWLQTPADTQTIRDRQEAAAELAGLTGFREQLQVDARLVKADAAAVEAFLSWCEQEVWLGKRALLRWAARGLTLANLTLMVLQAAGVIHRPLWMITILLSLILTAIFGGSLHRIFQSMSKGYGDAAAWSRLLALFHATRPSSPALTRLGRQISGVPPHKQMNRLDQLAGLAELRRSMLYLPLQLVLLWDFHVLDLLETWQKGPGRRVRTWFQVLAELEAMASLGNLAWEHPDWARPLVDPGEETFKASNLGHPLIPERVRVGNEVDLGPRGSFLLVTGSNMSGKTTLLRAVGINAVLAQAGGVVCASALTMPPVVLGTSIHVRDSLEQGVSFFLAELKKLKSVVDLLGQGTRLLYLLDEILRGTNAVERSEAVRRLLIHLLARDAIGAISTHDLSLAELPGLGSACRPVHFTETFSQGTGGPVMEFDYKLKDGISTTSNALKLLEIVGIELSS